MNMIYFPYMLLKFLPHINSEVLAACELFDGLWSLLRFARLYFNIILSSFVFFQCSP